MIITTKEEIREAVSQIKKITSLYKNLSSYCDAAVDLGVLEVDGPFFNAIWETFEGMLDIFDVDGWISWYIYDNDCGGGERVVVIDGEERSIKSEEDLVSLILHSHAYPKSGA